MNTPDVITTPIISVNIIKVDTKNKIVLCAMPNSEIGYIPFEQYSIYFDSAKGLPKAQQQIKVISEIYDNKKQMYRLNSKVIQENYWATLKCGDIVQAQVIKIANDNMAFCDIGYGINGAIVLKNLLSLPESVYSIADVLSIGATFNVKIIGRSNRGNFKLTTAGIDEYKKVEIAKKAMIFGTVGKRVTDKDIFKNNQYHYYFHITFQLIGYISSEQPIGYNKIVCGKCMDDMKLKFNLSNKYM